MTSPYDKNTSRWPVLLVKIILGLSLLITAGCEPGSFNLSCDNCYSEKPSEGILYIDLARLFVIVQKLFKVYEGKLESGRVILQDTINQDYLDIWVPVGHFYTVVAEYIIDSTLIRFQDKEERPWSSVIAFA